MGKFKFVPLSSSFMAFAMVGFLITAIMQPINQTWTFAFGLLFVLMFMASLISMIEASPDEQLTARPAPEINLNIKPPRILRKKAKSKAKSKKPPKKAIKKKAGKKKRRKK